MPQPIVKRLTCRLDPDDKADLRRALLDFALDHEVDASTLRPDDQLLQKLYPFLHAISTNWKGLVRNIEWVGSTAHRHALEYLKNQLRLKGSVLSKRV